MSHYMTALAMRQKGLRPATKIVLYWLADHHNGETLKCFPSIKRLAACCEMSESSVRTQLKILQDAKLIQWTSHFNDDGRQGSNNYWLLLKEENTVGGLERYDEPPKNCRGEGVNSEGGRVQILDPNLVRDNQGKKEPVLLLGSIDDLEDLFEKFWQAYPRKVNKKKAKPVFAKALARVDFDFLLKRVRKYAESVQGVEPKFVKHATTFLNGDCWDDEFVMQLGNEQNIQTNVLNTMWEE